MNDKIRVLIVDDQEIVLQGLATILKYAPGIEVIGQARNGQQAIELAHQTKPDVVLMDLKMPVLGGVPATRRIVSDLPETQVIILTTYDTDNLVFEGIKAGARGYLLKDTTSEELIAAIRGVMRGESRIDPHVARKVLDTFRQLAQQMPRPENQDQEPPLEPLTAREEQVLKLLAQGLSNKEIAAQLYLSEGTIKNYVSAIISKLHANDRAHAVIRALRKGLIRL